MARSGTVDTIRRTIADFRTAGRSVAIFYSANTDQARETYLGYHSATYPEIIGSDQAVMMRLLLKELSQ